MHVSFDSNGTSFVTYKTYTSENFYYNILLSFIVNETIYNSTIVTNNKNNAVSYIFTSIVGPNNDKLTNGSWNIVNIEGIEYGVVSFYT